MMRFKNIILTGIGVAIIALMPFKIAHACALPTGVEGEIIYNSSFAVPAYCDGTNWIAMNGGDNLAGVLGTADGLMAYFKLDETTTGVAIDSSPFGNDGTHFNGLDAGTHNVDGITGRGLDFSNDVVHRVRSSAPPELSATGDYTMMAWIRPNSSVITRGIIAIGQDTGGNDVIQLTQRNTGVSLTTNLWAGGDYARYTDNILTTDQWNHVAVTYSYNNAQGTEPLFYLNGQPVPTVGGVNVMGVYTPLTAPEVLVSGRYDSSVSAFPGAMDDVRAYNRVLSQSEIQDIVTLTDKRKTKIVPTGLVGHWRLDETSGTIAYDSSGNNNLSYIDGADTSAHSTSGIVGNGFDFSGNAPTYTSTALTTTLTSSVSGNTASSVSVWVKPTEDPAAYGTAGIVEIPDYFKLRKSSFNNQLTYIQEGWTAARGTELIPSVLQVGQWTHIVITQDYTDPFGTNPKFYINGIEETSLNSFGGSGPYVTPTGTELRIGRRADSVISSFRGVLDDVRIYNRVISPAEITEIYNARDGIRYNANQRKMEYFDGNEYVSMTPQWPNITNGLIAHYKLDEISGTTATDATGNFNATYTGGTNPATDRIIAPVGMGMNFEANTGYAQTSLSSALQDFPTLTAAAWVRLDNRTAAGGILSLGSSSGGVPDIFEFQNKFNDRQLQFNAYSWNGTNGSWFTNADVLPIGGWVHVAVVYSYLDPVGTDPVMYINGALYTGGYNEVVSPTGSYAAKVSPLPILVGFRAGASSSHWRGALDDVRLYDRKLSADEIQKLYQMGTPIGSSTALPLGCPNIGDVCDDGTIYAGIEANGNTQEMYIFPTDEGEMFFNNGNSTGNFNATTVSDDGASNTLTLVQADSDTITVGIQEHQAAQACHDKNAFGADDWYLPADLEMRAVADIERTGIADIDLFDSGVAKFYFTSTQSSIVTNARTVGVFAGGSNVNGDANKSTTGLFVRCVRKGPAPRCANPYGLEGQMIYNGSEDVVQYCDGARWIGIGKRE